MDFILVEVDTASIAEVGKHLMVMEEVSSIVVDASLGFVTYFSLIIIILLQIFN